MNSTNMLIANVMQNFMEVFIFENISKDLNQHTKSKQINLSNFMFSFHYIKS